MREARTDDRFGPRFTLDAQRLSRRTLKCLDVARHGGDSSAVEREDREETRATVADAP